MADTVFLVGTGAEDGAWCPIIRAIHDTCPGASVCQTPDHANFYLAKLIAIVRADRAQQAQNGKRPSGPMTDYLRELKVRICDCLREATASGALILRPHFRDVASSSEWGDSKTFVTTN